MKTWFITGASRGFGRAFAEAALARGDRVAATARRPETLRELVAEHGEALLPLALDVTDRAAVQAAVGEAVERFGRLDVVVNNAGYGLAGAVEETTEREARDQMETNFFGALWVTQAVLPQLRAQGAGHIVQVSSIGGVGAFPLLSVYNASKWALEGLSEALAQEVAPFGIKVTLVEPGPFRTDWAGDSMQRSQALEVYDGPLAEARARFAGEISGRQPGSPERAAQALLEVVDSDEPPLRLLMGAIAVGTAAALQQARQEEYARWERLALATDYDAEAVPS